MRSRRIYNTGVKSVRGIKLDLGNLLNLKYVKDELNNLTHLKFNLYKHIEFLLRDEVVTEAYSEDIQNGVFKHSPKVTTMLRSIFFYTGVMKYIQYKTGVVMKLIITDKDIFLYLIEGKH